MPDGSAVTRLRILLSVIRRLTFVIRRRARSSAGQNAPLITVLSQVRVLPGPPSSPDIPRGLHGLARIARVSATFAPSIDRRATVSAGLFAFSEESLWRRDAWPTPSCCREFEPSLLSQVCV